MSSADAVEEPRWLTAEEQQTRLAVIATATWLPDEVDAQLQRDAGIGHFEHQVTAMRSMPPQRTRRTAAPPSPSSPTPAGTRSPLPSRSRRRGASAGPRPADQDPGAAAAGDRRADPAGRPTSRVPLQPPAAAQRVTGGRTYGPSAPSPLSRPRSGRRPRQSRLHAWRRVQAPRKPPGRRGTRDGTGRPLRHGTRRGVSPIPLEAVTPENCCSSNL
jgi:hypothetical protein